MTEDKMTDDGRLRLQVFMAKCGVGGRRFCEDLISQGRVMVNNRIVREMGLKVGDDDVVQVDGETIELSTDKPAFYLTVESPERPLLLSDNSITLLPGGRTVIPTGIAIALPSADYVALVLARSGLGIKHGVVPSNCVGVIDSDYRGEIMVGLYNSGESEYTVQPADRIAQLMVVPVVQAQIQMVDELDETQRGTGGFGSTGK